jgi:hypothetical protein
LCQLKYKYLLAIEPADILRSVIFTIIMAQATNTDIREIKDLILGLDKKIDEVKTEIRGLDKKIDIIDIRLVEVEKKIDKQDTRLWAFGGIILAACLGTIVKLLAFPSV